MTRIWQSLCTSVIFALVSTSPLAETESTGPVTRSEDSIEEKYSCESFNELENSKLDETLEDTESHASFAVKKEPSVDASSPYSENYSAHLRIKHANESERVGESVFGQTVNFAMHGISTLSRISSSKTPFYSIDNRACIYKGALYKKSSIKITHDNAIHYIKNAKAVTSDGHHFHILTSVQEPENGCVIIGNRDRSSVDFFSERGSFCCCTT